MVGSGAYKSALGETSIHFCPSGRIRSVRGGVGEEKLNGEGGNVRCTLTVCQRKKLAQGRSAGCRWKRVLIAVQFTIGGSVNTLDPAGCGRLDTTRSPPFSSLTPKPTRLENAPRRRPSVMRSTSRVRTALAIGVLLHSPAVELS